MKLWHVSLYIRVFKEASRGIINVLYGVKKLSIEMKTM